MTKKLLTKSFLIPASLEIEMNKRIVSLGYGLRGKSKWINEAVLNFLCCPDEQFVLECIGYSEELERLDKSITFRPTQEVADKLSDWVVKARLSMPTIEGVNSKIIRTAIIHGLLGSAESIKSVAQKASEAE